MMHLRDQQHPRFRSQSLIRTTVTGVVAALTEELSKPVLLLAA